MLEALEALEASVRLDGTESSYYALTRLPQNGPGRSRTPACDGEDLAGEAAQR